MNKNEIPTGDFLQSLVQTISKMQNKSNDAVAPKTKEKSGYGFIVDDYEHLRKALETFSDNSVNVYQLDTFQFYIEINDDLLFKRDVYSKVRSDAFFYKRRTKNARNYIKEFGIQLKERMIYLVDRKDPDYPIFCQLPLRRRVCENLNYRKDVKISIHIDNENLPVEFLSDTKWAVFFSTYLDRIMIKNLKKKCEEQNLNTIENKTDEKLYRRDKNGRFVKNDHVEM